MRLCGLLVLLALFPCTVSAQSFSGDEIRKLFEGNTVSGRYMNRRFFTEFHHPDGRALGNNGWAANTDACWTTTDKHVCYYYGPPKQRTVHCFTVELTNRLYLLKTVENETLNAVATIEPGNPRNHDGQGTNWYCDGNISQLPGQVKGQFATFTPRPSKLNQ